jgi:ribose transport system permease protein
MARQQDIKAPLTTATAGNAPEPEDQPDLRGSQLPAWLSYLDRFWILGVLLILVLYFTLTTPAGSFLSGDNLRNIALDTATVLLLAIGETFVIITAGIDLSVGAVLLFSGVLAGVVMLHLSGTQAQVDALEYPHQNTAIPVGVVVGLLAGFAWGLFNGALITRFKLPPFIVTLGTYGMATGGADLLAGGTNITSVPDNFHNYVDGPGYFTLPIPVCVAIIVIIISWFVLRFTRFGQYTCAIGANPQGTRLAGVNTDFHLLKVYALAGLLAGLAGVLDLGRFGTENLQAHATDNLNAIAAVVIGGTSLFGGVGTIMGTVVGAFIPTVLANGFTIQNVSSFWQLVAVGAIIIIAVQIDQWRRSRAAQ